MAPDPLRCQHQSFSSSLEFATGGEWWNGSAVLDFRTALPGQEVLEQLGEGGFGVESSYVSSLTPSCDVHKDWRTYLFIYGAFVMGLAAVLQVAAFSNAKQFQRKMVALVGLAAGSAGSTLYVLDPTVKFGFDWTFTALFSAAIVCEYICVLQFIERYILWLVTNHGHENIRLKVVATRSRRAHRILIPLYVLGGLTWTMSCVLDWSNLFSRVALIRAGMVPFTLASVYMGGALFLVWSSLLADMRSLMATQRRLVSHFQIKASLSTKDSERKVKDEPLNEIRPFSAIDKQNTSASIAAHGQLGIIERRVSQTQVMSRWCYVFNTLLLVLWLAPIVSNTAFGWWKWALALMPGVWGSFYVAMLYFSVVATERARRKQRKLVRYANAKIGKSGETASFKQSIISLRGRTSSFAIAASDSFKVRLHSIPISKSVISKT